jgi:acetyl-CoA carboxylase biotin carboxylase subunit
MISTLLIANRGEIAVRIIRAARELGIKSIVVYSEADQNSLAVKIADQAIKIGPPPVQESYLFYQNIISAALSAKADAIHPGYGFLAENPAFAEACRATNIKFVGPNALAIRKMGDKASAKALMKSANVPVVPGSDGIVENYQAVQSVAEQIGYPLIIKATAGGGGRGMRIVNEARELENAYKCAASEAGAAFGDASVYVEKFIIDPKHIEIQILSDKHGHVVHLFERDCSLQRRHQKLLEESPAAILDEEVRKKMGQAALLAARAVNYDSAGTVEFIYDIDTRAFYFIEMNTRIQVEHPVTEEITGVDLIKEQIKIAAAEHLKIQQKEIKRLGHAIECRINAEDPQNDFIPTPGKIDQFIVPGGPGIRVDSGVYPGDVISPYYDSMVAKLIARGRDRKEAVSRMKRALQEFIIEGIKTTIPFHLEVINHRAFLSGRYTTDFIKKFFS